MERTVPSTASGKIELYIRTYYSLLRTSAEVQIRTLEEAHSGINSSLHPNARQYSPDLSAFIYSLLRLPVCIREADLVILGQNSEDFRAIGYDDVESWQPTTAVARRRRSFFNGVDTLACYIASRTDIDDLIPLLTAYQIEWNKLHAIIQQIPGLSNTEHFKKLQEDPVSLAEWLKMSVEDLQRLEAIWGDRCAENLAGIGVRTRRIRVQLLNGSLSEYRRATRAWMNNLEAHHQELNTRPVYFISSNTHTVANLLSGYALERESEIVASLSQSDNELMSMEWDQIQNQEIASSRENFLYYALKKLQEGPAGRALVEAQIKHEEACGISRVSSIHHFDVDAQVIDLSALDPKVFDPRLRHLLGSDNGGLVESDALILNIDYPLGLSAYNILAKVAENAGKVLGIYILGKAATLNGVIGDVMIPSVVHDEHSQNTYLFQNCFTAQNVSPNLIYGNVIDNQRAVTVLGTYLQNHEYMDVFYREGYTDIEMEAGPYLSAVYESARPKRHPVNEIVNLQGLPFDLGIIHYASDTPLSKGKNLGAGSLSYFGMDSTYAAAVAILKRIFKLESDRLTGLGV